MLKLKSSFRSFFTFARTKRQTINDIKQKQAKNAIISELDDRCLLSVQGKDIKKILQGITTNDIQIISNPKYAAQYTTFLNIKGRIVADAFLIKPRMFNKDSKPEYVENEYWIDVHKDLKESLFKHISKYFWKKDAKISDVDNLKICTLYGVGSLDIKDSGMLMQPPGLLTGQQGNYSNLSFVDPRTPSLGMRMIMNGDQYKDPSFTILSTENYNIYTLLHGIAQGSQLTQKIPFQYNIDLLRGISFKKGCYIGQQLIARSYYTGVVRRRIFPFVLDNPPSPDTDFKKGKSIFDKNIEIGKVVVFDQKRNIGLALVNYLDNEFIEDEMKIKEPVGMMLLNPLRREIEGYMNELKEKQRKNEEIDE